MWQIFNLVFSFVIILTLAGEVRSQEAVRLKVAFGENYAVSGMTVSWTHIRAKVKNIDYNKNVIFHYKDSDGNWKDHPLEFLAHYGNYDVFTGIGTAPVTNEFAIKYIVPGQEHWDNNQSQNYKIGTHSGAVGGNVMLKEATARIGRESGAGYTVTTSWLEGLIYVQNLAYEKKVGVRYSADGGTNWENVEASFAGKAQAAAGTVDSVEIWRFKTPTLSLSSPDHFKFAVFYERRDPGPNLGKIFWDNNFGQDYQLIKREGVKIE